MMELLLNIGVIWSVILLTVMVAGVIQTVSFTIGLVSNIWDYIDILRHREGKHFKG